jgi:cholest-4-en-3-one 26-monooxygenase
VTTGSPLTLRAVNLLDPALYANGDPHAQWRLLRAEAPVFRHERFGDFPPFWAITHYDDIVRVSRDPRSFVSSKGITPGDDPDAPTQYPGNGIEMIRTDPPRHVRLRRLVNKGFTPRQIAALESHVREIVSGILDSLAGQREGDFVTDVAAKLPLAVICELMGLPPSDWQLMFDWTNAAIGSGDAEYQQPGETAQQAGARSMREMFAYFGRLAADRRQQRRDDLMTVLVDADLDGDKLSEEEILFFCFLLIIAGNETTRNATSGGMLALAQHPEQWRALCHDAALIPAAIEEVLRWTSPVLDMARVASNDVELDGQLIRAGEKLIMFYPSANRDESVFPDPYRFDIRRTPNEHLAFGVGEHFCLGASLARLELRVMFEELAMRLPEIAVTGEPARLRSNFIGGIKHLPVRYRP